MWPVWLVSDMLPHDNLVVGRFANGVPLEKVKYRPC